MSNYIFPESAIFKPGDCCYFVMRDFFDKPVKGDYNFQTVVTVDEFVEDLITREIVEPNGVQSWITSLVRTAAHSNKSIPIFIKDKSGYGWMPENELYLATEAEKILFGANDDFST